MEKTNNLVFHNVTDSAKNIHFESVIGKDVSHEFPFHVHHSLCIGLITKGMRRIVFPENEVCIREGELFVINPLQPHAIQQRHPHDYAIITVKGLSDCPIFNRHIQSVQCKRLFVNLLDAIRHHETKELSAHWDRLFASLCRYQGNKIRSTGTNTVIEKTMIYIAANYQNPITVSDIAKYNCMSVFHYCRIFKLMTGISPHKYLIQYRLSMSRKYLQEEKMIFDAAIDSGFYDSSHFIRNFYNYMAISPKSYRQSILKNSKNIQ
jgi:AraC-like DNA-binding protein/mannose-6-phosphate isomerase-like protein (cupin superfamily)